jgi:hypothetical protein
MNVRHRRLASTISWVVLLSACGGGGGGGGDERLTLDRSELTIARPSDSTTSPTATVTGKISGSPDRVYLFIEHSGGVIQSVTTPDVSGSSGTSTVILAAPSSVGPGDYAASIVVRACHDFGCSSQFEGSPRTIAVRYVVGMPVDPPSIRVEGIEGVATATQSVAFSHYAGSVNWNASVQDTGSGTGWVQITPQSGTTTPATTSIGFTARPVGDDHAIVRLSAAGEQRDIPVDFVVRSAIGVGQAMIDIDDSDLQGPISYDLGIDSLDPSREFAWSVTLSGLPWLSVTKGSGQTGVDAGATLQVLPEAIRTLPNGVYAANLRVESTTPGVTAIDATVYVAIARAFTDSVAPAVESTGYVGQVLVTATDLSGVTPIGRVLIGDVAAPAFVTRSRSDGASQLRIDVPALPAGRYPITVESQSGRRSQGRAELVLMDALDYTVAGATPAMSTSEKRYVQVFDAARRTIYSMPVGLPDYVYAARFDGTGWVQTHSSETLSSCYGATLAANGRSLVGTCQASTVQGYVDIDPDTLELRRAWPASGYLAGLTANADGTVWAGAGTGFGGAAYTPDGVRAYRLPDFPMFMLAASGAGNSLLSYQQISPNAPLRRVDPFSAESIPFLESYPLSLHSVRGDRFGTRRAQVGEWTHSAQVIAVYDDAGAFRGQVDYRPGGSYIDAFIDEDGTRLYVLGASFLPEINGGIAVYDLTQPPVGDDLVLLGRIPLTALGALFVGVTPDGTQVLTSNGDQVQATKLLLPETQPDP